MNNIEEIQIENEEVKVSLFTNDTILYIKGPKTSTRKCVWLINTFNKVVGYQHTKISNLSISK